MKKEKIILSFSALIIGVLVAIVGFFIYQTNKEVKTNEIKTVKINSTTPTPASSLFLTIDSPNDESVVENKTLKISGKTMPGAKIVILTQSNEVGTVPSSDGSFSTNINLALNENIIEISAISSTGEIVKVKRVVTYSTEDF